MKKRVGITLCIITLAMNATFAHDLNYHHEFTTIQLRKNKVVTIYTHTGEIRICTVKRTKKPECGPFVGDEERSVVGRYQITKLDENTVVINDTWFPRIKTCYFNLGANKAECSPWTK
jgi:hypothetical protein